MRCFFLVFLFFFFFWARGWIWLNGLSDHFLFMSSVNLSARLFHYFTSSVCLAGPNTDDEPKIEVNNFQSKFCHVTLLIIRWRVADGHSRVKLISQLKHRELAMMKGDLTTEKEIIRCANICFMKHSYEALWWHLFGARTCVILLFPRWLVPKFCHCLTVSWPFYCFTSSLSLTGTYTRD